MKKKRLLKQSLFELNRYGFNEIVTLSAYNEYEKSICSHSELER